MKRATFIQIDGDEAAFVNICRPSQQTEGIDLGHGPDGRAGRNVDAAFDALLIERFPRNRRDVEEQAFSPAAGLAISLVRICKWLVKMNVGGIGWRDNGNLGGNGARGQKGNGEKLSYHHPLPARSAFRSSGVAARARGNIADDEILFGPLAAPSPHSDQKRCDRGHTGKQSFGIFGVPGSRRVVD